MKNLFFVSTALLLFIFTSNVKAQPRSLFDGVTLEGWHTTPRVYVPGRESGFAAIHQEELKAAVIKYNEQQLENLI